MNYKVLCILQSYFLRRTRRCYRPSREMPDMDRGVAWLGTVVHDDGIALPVSPLEACGHLAHVRRVTRVVLISSYKEHRRVVFYESATGRAGDSSSKWKVPQWKPRTLEQYSHRHTRSRFGEVGFWGHILWNPVWGEFISIPRGVIGMAVTCEDKSRAVPRSHSEWSVVIGSRRMARSAGI